MNPFLNTRFGTKRSFTEWLRGRPALVVFVLCLALGLSAVVWRALARSAADRAHAQVEAQARVAALELQFGKGISATELLGALVEQSGGALTNFARLAIEALAQRPGVASLELQPGGIVSDIVPWSGHERVIGFSVLKDSAQRADAEEAIRRHAITVSGPLKLYRGDSGLVVRRPIFLRAHGGRETFWGFVAASMRLSEIAFRAGLDGVSTNGYDYALFLPASGRQKLAPIAVRGTVSLAGAIQQPVRIQDLELRLALQPQAGWINKAQLGLDALAAVIGAGLVALLVNLVQSRRAVEIELIEANQLAAREATARQQAQDECRRAQEDMASTRADRQAAQSALEAAQAKVAELKGRLESSIVDSGEAGKSLQRRVEQAERTVVEMQDRFEATVRKAEEEAKAGQAELQRAQQTSKDLHSRLEAATRTEADSVAVVQSRLTRTQATVAELETKLQAANRSASQAEKTGAARVAELESEIAALKSRLARAEQAEGRVEELTTQLAAAQAELRSVQDSPRRAKVSSTNEESKADSRPTPEPILGDGQSAPDPVARSEASASPATPRALKVADEANEPEVGRAENGVQPGIPSPKVPGPRTAVTVVKITGGARRRKSRNDGQMDFFEEKPEPDRRLPAPPPVNPSELRTAVNQILPLLVDADPGARDCLKDNRSTFRSAFAPEAFVEFEQLVKEKDFGTALEQLRKAARKHGVPV